MSWSFTAKGTAQEAAKSIREQANAAIGARSDAEKVVILSGAEAVGRIADQYPETELAISFYGHAGDKDIGSYVLNIATPPKQG